MNEQYIELLEKWKNFSKVYDDIRKAFSLGYNEGVKDGKYCKMMSDAELLDGVNVPTAEYNM